jgi:cardiolipin synthase A/B
MRRSPLAILPAAALAMTSLTTPAHAATGTQTLITEPDQGLTSIYSLITSAKKSIDMTMYELQDTTVEHDLGNAATAGVKVRVTLDQNLEKSNNQAAYTYLSGHGVSVVWAAKKYAATHQKSIVVDGATSAVLTLNLTPRYYSTSRDFGVITTDAGDAAAIEKVFNADFTGATVTPGDGDDLVWSPTDSQTQLLGIINSATTSLLVENEEMSDTAIVNALVSAASRGVSVQIVMTDDGSYHTEFNKLVAAGAKISTYDPSASLYIHAKVIIADYGKTGGRTFLGSENFSSNSLTKNRELGLITTGSAIQSSLKSTLTSDFNSGTLYS